MKKQIGIFLLMVCICLGTMYGQSSTGTWTIERTEGGCILTGYNGPDTDIIIPAKWGGLNVIGIGDYILRNKKITSVTIPEGVTTIGSRAFTENQISRVTLPSTITSIGGGAFMNNELTTITLPANLETIEDYAFSSNKLTRITLPEKLQTIEIGAFANNQLTNVTIPASVTNFGRESSEWWNDLHEGNPFYGNETLLQIDVADENPVFASDDGVLFSKDQKKLIAYPTGKGATTTVPSGVEVIGTYSFYDANIRSLIIPSSVTAIEANAFDENQIISITIPKDIDAVSNSFNNNFVDYYDRGGRTAGIYIYDNGRWSMYNNTDEMLETEFTEDGLAVTGYKGYGGSLEIPSEIDGFPVVSIDSGAFAGKGLTNVTIPESITTIGNGAFSSNELQTIMIPSNVTLIHNGAFAGNPFDETIRQTLQEKYGKAVLGYQIGDIGPAGGIIFYDKGSYSDGWRYL
jgi:hypothetical protein